jgi:hypothetical protein
MEVKTKENYAKQASEQKFSKIDEFTGSKI